MAKYRPGTESAGRQSRRLSNTARSAADKLQLTAEQDANSTGMLNTLMGGEQRSLPDQAADERFQSSTMEQTGELRSTADEETVVRQMVHAGKKILYSEQTHEKVVEMLKAGASNPPQALALATGQIVGQMGRVPSIRAKARGTSKILALVAEVANSSGAFPVDGGIVRAATEMVANPRLKDKKLPPREQAAALQTPLGPAPTEEPGPGAVDGAINRAMSAVGV